ncbi:hypothetical protein OQJ26_02965 [Legionella sp. PATHC038]|uniref:hypothetical protein n=1 Tax=Legionella sheltonii TaxID=2992041 RepID=UPI002243F39D|nr:hypothetical protein [Legionella sp. PATHC038]MCW8397748.1 hypothetical protein [Legionella sp. PATHC038]
MPFKYRAITANCGNDTIGIDASRELAEKIEEDIEKGGADFYIINCQETHFEKTQQQLEAVIGEGYKVQCLGQMATHTKLDTQFHSNTGIASFIVYKKELVISDINSTEARRTPASGFLERISSGAGFNKGGLVTNFAITREDGERIDIQALSGHLDASSMLKRNQDWHVLHKKTIKDVRNWDELLAACPNLMVSGYDANTRNRLDDNNKEINMWESPEKYPEIQALDRVSLAAARYSGKSTYEHAPGPDPKRPGYAGGGMLDFVTIYDGEISAGRIITDEQLVKQIEPEPNSERDHNVIISPLHTSFNVSPFERVRNLMASRLHGVAPLLAEKIQKMKETEDAKDQLIEIYQKYLGPEGFLDKAIALHQSKLECVQQLKKLSLDERLQEQVSKTLFGELEWCAGDPEQLAAKQELMKAFLTSLADCEHAVGIKVRLNCYLDLKEKIERNEKINADKAFQDAAVKSYESFYIAFENKLKTETNDKPELQGAMKKLLNRLDAIADHENFEALRNLEPKKLDVLTHIVAECYDSFNFSHAGDIEDMEKTNEEINRLAHEAMGSSSPVWRALAEAVKFFVSIVSKVSRDSTLAEQGELVKSKQLSDSIRQYRTALHDMRPQENSGSDDENIMTLD